MNRDKLEEGISDEEDLKSSIFRTEVLDSFTLLFCLKILALDLSHLGLDELLHLVILVPWVMCHYPLSFDK